MNTQVSPSPWAEHFNELDVLGTLEKQAARLSAYIERTFERNPEEGWVIGLEAGWGFGKTFFLEGFVEGLKHNHTVVYFNVWEKSFASDPLQAFAAEITKQIEFTESKQDLATLAKAVMRSSVGKEVAEAIINLIPGATAAVKATELLYNLNKAISDLNKQECLDDYHAEEVRQLALNQIVYKAAAYAKNTHNSPLLIVIDELDRCSPEYALKVLERIKHVMNVKDTCFIVAYDPEQLEDFIRKNQGTRENRQSEYLDKFFHRRWLLPKSTYYEFVAYMFKLYSLDNPETLKLNDIFYEKMIYKDFIKKISYYFEQNNTSLRSQKIFFENYSLFIEEALSYFHNEISSSIFCEIIYINTMTDYFMSINGYTSHNINNDDSIYIKDSVLIHKSMIELHKNVRESEFGRYRVSDISWNVSGEIHNLSKFILHEVVDKNIPPINLDALRKYTQNYVQNYIEPSLPQ